MATCEMCGNDYSRPLEIDLDGTHHTFDCFECAISALAPQCAHCGCRVIGHGVENLGSVYCCDHCARHVQHGARAPQGAHGNRSPASSS